MTEVLKSEVWMKIYHHSVKYGYFSSLEEAKYCMNEGRFSMLKSISDSMKIEGQFEFRLEYPQDGLVYHWKQSDNPLSIHEGELKSDNYSQLLAPSDSRGWGGYLAQSTISQCTLLDGMSSKYWWFSIGTIQCPKNIDPYFTVHPDTIPGPADLPVKEVVLWIRVPNSTKSRDFQKLHLLLAILFLNCKFS